MNLALAGYGKMGRLIEAAALSLGHRVVAAVDPAADNGKTVSGAPLVKTIAELPAGIDAAIEFTHPSQAVDNIKALVTAGFPVVCGTTGWYERFPEVEVAVKAAGGSLVWSSNFSTGVRLFWDIAAYAAREAAPFTEYDIGGYEAHHNRKADSPSGTAKTLVERVLSAQTRKRRVVYDKLEAAPEPDELHFASLRIGGEPGTHVLYFDSEADYIEIRHTARNREGFARGALRAAEWLFNGGDIRRGVFSAT